MIIVNIDEFPSYYQGVAYINEDQKAYPSTAALFRTINKNTDFVFRTNTILPVDPNTGMTGQWEEIKKNYAPNLALSQFADVTGSCRGDSLILSWNTDTNGRGACTLPRSLGQASHRSLFRWKWAGRGTRRMLLVSSRGGTCFAAKTVRGDCGLHFTGPGARIL